MRAFNNLQSSLEPHHTISHAYTKAAVSEQEEDLTLKEEPEPEEDVRVVYTQYFCNRPEVMCTAESVARRTIKETESCGFSHPKQSFDPSNMTAKQMTELLEREAQRESEVILESYTMFWPNKKSLCMHL